MGIRYESEDPVEITHYGDSYGGVQTFKGGYDSEEDAKRGIQRNFEQEEPAEELYIEDREPLDDYNGDGYYMPLQDRRSQEEDSGLRIGEVHLSNIFQTKGLRLSKRMKMKKKKGGTLAEAIFAIFDAIVVIITVNLAIAVNRQKKILPKPLHSNSLFGPHPREVFNFILDI